MERAALKSRIHGEPYADTAALEKSQLDRITVNLTGGSISFVVPDRVPDDSVVQSKYLERSLTLKLNLENGAQLLAWINAASRDAGFKIKPPRKPRSRKNGSAKGCMEIQEWR